MNEPPGFARRDVSRTSEHGAAMSLLVLCDVELCGGEEVGKVNDLTLEALVALTVL